MAAQPAWTITRVLLIGVLLAQATGCMHWEKETGLVPVPREKAAFYWLTLQDGRKVGVRNAVVTADSIVGLTYDRGSRLSVALREVRSYERLGQSELATLATVAGGVGLVVLIIAYTATAGQK